ncbi:hypothetical protein [Mycoplasma seminis]|uniref:Extracellular matrix-binding protein ebh GA module domain-containing protein n=1 Tax=Mycoplasma seminis TaxID=512749 RepID=A0ABY9H9Q0_9MOLU|nr:hypothetical protein [Mycoplasma seminis]WLP85257.1 hypothetical protein Q8852_02960 [Mycoplasma seminis]
MSKKFFKKSLTLITGASFALVPFCVISAESNSDVNDDNSQLTTEEMVENIKKLMDIAATRPYPYTFYVSEQDPAYPDNKKKKIYTTLAKKENYDATINLIKQVLEKVPEKNKNYWYNKFIEFFTSANEIYKYQNVYELKSEIKKQINKHPEYSDVITKNNGTSLNLKTWAINQNISEIQKYLQTLEVNINAIVNQVKDAKRIFEGFPQYFPNPNSIEAIENWKAFTEEQKEELINKIQEQGPGLKPKAAKEIIEEWFKPIQEANKKQQEENIKKSYLTQKDIDDIFAKQSTWEEKLGAYPFNDGEYEKILTGIQEVVDIKKPLVDKINESNIDKKYKDALIKYLNSNTDTEELKKIQPTVSQLLDQVQKAIDPTIANRVSKLNEDDSTAVKAQQTKIDELLKSLNNLKYSDAEKLITDLTEANTKIANTLDFAEEIQNLLNDFKTNYPNISLSKSRITTAKDEIKKCNNISELNTLKEKLATLERSIADLKAKYDTTSKNIKDNVFDYEIGMPDVKTQLDTLMTTINSDLTTNSSLDSGVYQGDLTELNSTWNNLNALNNMYDYQFKLRQALMNAKNLTQKQRDAIAGSKDGWVDPNSEQNLEKNKRAVTQYESYVNQIDTLNNLMGELKSALESAETKMQTDDYLAASEGDDNNPGVKKQFLKAVNDAKAVIDDKNYSVIDPETIQSLIDAFNVNLDGQDNLNQLRNNLISKINSSHLNDAQQKTLVDEVKSATYNGLTAVETKFTNLNTAMEGLDKYLQTIPSDIKSQIKYSWANNKETFDGAFKTANDLVKASGDDIQNPETINGYKTALEKAYGDLNGEANLQNAREAANKQIEVLDTLSQAQKDHFTGLVNQKTTQADIDAQVTVAQALKTDIEALKTVLADAKKAQSSPNYLNSSQDNKTAVVNAITAAEDLINALNSTNPEDFTGAKSTLETALGKLNGDKLLADAKNALKAKINTSNLNDAQKTTLIAKVYSADVTTLEGVSAIETKFTDLNTAMQGLDNYLKTIPSDIKNQVKYSWANNKETFDGAFKTANDVVKASGDDIQNPETINGYKTALEKAYGALNGETNLQNAREAANKQIEALDTLSQTQKDHFKGLVNQKTTQTDIDAQVTAAQALKTDIEALKTALADAKKAQNSSNYLNSSSDKKTDVDNAIKAAEDLLKALSSPNPEDFTGAKSTLESALGKLNGDKLLADAKNALKAKINASSLNDKQKATLIDKVDSADVTTLEGVSAIETKFTDLNTAMQGLDTYLKTIPSDIKNQVKYSWANNKEAFDGAFKTANDVVKASGDDIQNPETINGYKTALEKAYGALNGETNLQNAREAANKQIEALDTLSQTQKDHFKGLVNQKTTQTDIDAQISAAQSLKTDIQSLKTALADAKKAQNSSNYLNSSSDKKTAVVNAITAAEDLINALNSTNPEDFTGAKSALEKALGKLNGDKLLADAKNALKEKINTSSLNDKQKATLIDKVDSADVATLEGVSAIETEFNNLNTAMQKLQKAIKANENTKNTDAYKYASNTEGFDKALQNAIDAVAANRNDLNLGEVDKLTNALNASSQALNGLNQNAIKSIQASLLSPQEKETNIAKLNNKVFNKDEIDALYNELLPKSKQVAVDKINTLSPMLLAQKNQFIQSINDASMLNDLDKAFDKNVQDILAQAQESKTGLDSILNNIQNLNNLNKQEKEALKANILAANNLTDANNILQSATALNQALGDVIVDLNNYAAGQDGTKVQNDIKSIQDNVIKQGEQVISQPQDYTNIYDAITEIQALENLLNSYKASNVSAVDYNSKKSALQQALTNAATTLNKLKNISATALEALKTSQSDKLNQLITEGTNVISLVESINQKDETNAQSSIDNLIRGNVNKTAYNNLKQALDSNKYFKVIESNKSSKEEIKQLKDSIQALNVPEVVKSALLKNIADLNPATKFAWWIYVTIVSALSFTAAMLMICFRPKKK